MLEVAFSSHPINLDLPRLGVESVEQVWAAFTGVPSKHRESAHALLAEARTARDLPALSAGDAVLMPQTSLSNTFICQPQQRNMHGRMFGGFLMRCQPPPYSFKLALTSRAAACLQYTCTKTIIFQ